MCTGFRLKLRVPFFIVSLLLMAASWGLVAVNGLNLGIDFAGGTLIQVRFESPAEIEAVKSGLAAMEMAGSSVQAFGDAGDNEYLIRTDLSLTTGEDFTGRLKSTLAEKGGSAVEIL